MNKQEQRTAAIPRLACQEV